MTRSRNAGTCVVYIDIEIETGSPNQCPPGGLDSTSQRDDRFVKSIQWRSRKRNVDRYN